MPIINGSFINPTASARDLDFSADRPSPSSSHDSERVITLASDSSTGIGWYDHRRVKFFVTPELSEARNVNYLEISEMRQAGGLLVYIGTQPRTYTLNARFVSRTPDEADRSWKYLQILKSWATPNKDAANAASDTQSRTGGEANAPEVLRLYGYGVNKQLRWVPVVLTSLTIEYPANISYIKTNDDNAQVPIIQTISIGLKEARNMDELNNFDLTSYKNGTLNHW